VTVDLRTEGGRAVVRRLAATCDVLVENFRPGVMEGWGLGPADLHPSLIYTRISGYGQTGPKAALPGYASVCEAYGGFRHLNGYPDRAPVRPNISLGDSLAGLHAAFGAVMALLHRDRDRGRDGRGGAGGGAGGGPGAGEGGGGGQVVDAAISESMFNMLEGCLSEFGATGAVRPPSGAAITGVVPTGCWRAADGVHVIVGGNGNRWVVRLGGVVGGGWWMVGGVLGGGELRVGLGAESSLVGRCCIERVGRCCIERVVREPWRGLPASVELRAGALRGWGGLVGSAALCSCHGGDRHPCAHRTRAHHAFLFIRVLRAACTTA
jgi:hypothetical protein